MLRPKIDLILYHIGPYLPKDIKYVLNEIYIRFLGVSQELAELINVQVEAGVVYTTDIPPLNFTCLIPMLEPLFPAAISNAGLLSFFIGG